MTWASKNITDKNTRAQIFIEYTHHGVHDGDSYSVYYNRTTDATDGHRSGLYIKTPNSDKRIHIVVEYAASTASTFSICEAPTIAANTGTHANVVYNRDRNSSNESTVFDNAATPAAGKFTTLTEAEIAGDATFDSGTVIRLETVRVGDSPKPAGGTASGEQEYILKANTAYIFLLTNTTASANTHYILADWYEHVNL